MTSKYIVRKGLKYLNSINILNEDLMFIPNWSKFKEQAFPFINEFDAQIIAEEIGEADVKWEKLSWNTFKKDNNLKFQEEKKNFERLLR